MSETEAAPSTGALSQDAAVALLNSRADTAVGRVIEQDNNPAPAAEAAPGATEQAAEPTAEDLDAAAETLPSEEEGAEQPEPEPQAPAIAAPQSWDAEATAHWTALPAELQTYLVGREASRDKAVSTAQREAADARKSASDEIANVRQFHTDLTAFIGDTVQRLKPLWGDNPDWNEVAKLHGPEQAFRLRAQYEAEQADLAKLRDAEGKAQAIVYADWQRTERTKLDELIPDFDDKGRQSLGQYLVKNGASIDELKQAGAHLLLFGWKAQKWDNHEADLKAQATARAKDAADLRARAGQPRPATTATPPRPAMRPSAANPQSAGDSAATLNRRLAQTGSISDAVAVLAHRQKAAR